MGKRQITCVIRKALSREYNAEVAAIRRQLAAKLKVSRQTVDAIETGRSLPAIPPAVAIARSSRTAHRGGLPWRPCPGGPCRLSA